MKEIEKQFWMEGQQFFFIKRERERERSKENEREDAVENI